jgi:hypothetical protein
VGVSYEKAARLNPTYAWITSPPWRDRIDQVVAEIGFGNMSPGPQAFADAVSAWQQSRGLTADGVLGPVTWKAMEPSTRYCLDVLTAPLEWLAVPADAKKEDPAKGIVPLFPVAFRSPQVWLPS